MWEPEEKIEVLINRRLDGTLTGDEQLELDRALIRSPEHRRMLEVSQRIDELCCDALRRELACSAPGRSADFVPIDRVGIRRRFPRWWIVPGALAACLGFMVVTGVVSVPGGNDLSPPVGGGSIVARPALRPAFDGNGIGREFRGNGLPVTSRVAGGREGLRRVRAGFDVLDRRRDSSVYGIVGQDGRIYFIELERTRMYRHPRAGSKMRFVGHDL